MRVLLLFPMYDKQTGSAIKKAFENLGHEVYAVDAKMEPQNSYAMALQLVPELVFCSRTKELTEQLERIKQRFPNAKSCVWNVDTRDSINEWRHLFPLIRACDYYFVVASGLVDEWRELNPNTFWLPQGLQDEVYDKPAEITGHDRLRYSCDVSFAGNDRDVRSSFLKAIDGMNINFKRWGCGDMPKVYNEEHSKMVSLSKINLCCSGWTRNGKYTSVRNYKIMGAGGFTLELYRKGIIDIFPDDTYGFYYDADDLVRVIKYWLDHEKDREEFAEKGYQWVHAHATYTHRIRKAIDYMELNRKE